MRSEIGRSTAKSHVNDVEEAILKTFRGANITSFPSQHDEQQMVNIQKKKGAPQPQVSLTLHGKHAKCVGKTYGKRTSWKCNFQPCFNCLFIIERMFGRVVAFNLDESSRKHDITVLRKSNFFSEPG